MYYRTKLDSLRAVFGQHDVALADGGLIVAGRCYPIVDDVIILIDPACYPPSLRARLGIEQVTSGAGRPSFAEDIQFSFGAEWQAFSRILPEHEEEFRQYFDLVDIPALTGKRICDLGCGIGRWSYFLREVAGELVLVDFSEAIFVARHNLAASSNALFFMADIRQLPFADNFADFLFCLGVLHHLPSPALDEVRALRRFAPELLVYLYYALDNRPAYYRALLKAVTRLRLLLANLRNASARAAVTNLLAGGVYMPLIGLGHALGLLGLGSRVPLFEGYRGKSFGRIRQDVYDRFFTRIEQRVTRGEIRALADTFSSVAVSDMLPYWHFLCKR